MMQGKNIESAKLSRRCFCCWNCKDEREATDAEGGQQGNMEQKEKHKITRHHRRTRPSFRKRVAEFFKLRNDKNETFADEIVGGVTMYLVSLLMMTLANGLQGMSLLFFLSFAMTVM